MPPGINNDWDKNNANQQALLLAYEQIRQYEEIEELQILAGAKL